MNIDSLEKLYVHELKDLYSAENQILQALSTMIDATSDSALRAALRDHHEQTEQHVQRIAGLFGDLEFEPGGHKCRGIEGLLSEASHLLEDVSGDSVKNAAIIASCQRIEHYEIAAYGVARAFASKLGRHEDVAVLTRTIEEEGAADRTLSRLAEHHINFTALTT